MTDQSPIADRYQKLLVVLDANLRYLQSVKVDEETLTAYKELLRYLRSRSHEKIADIVGRPHALQTGVKSHLPRFQGDEIRAMTAERVRQVAVDPSIPRRDLEEIASIRFGMTKGGLSSLRSRDALVQKLMTLIGHESTHESIARVVDAAKPLEARKIGR